MLLIENGAAVIHPEQLRRHVLKEKWGAIGISGTTYVEIDTPFYRNCASVLSTCALDLLVIYGLPEDKQPALLSGMTDYINNALQDPLKIRMIDGGDEFKNIFDALYLKEDGVRALVMLKTTSRTEAMTKIDEVINSMQNPDWLARHLAKH